MKPVELSEFDVNRIIYEETKSVVKELSLLEAVPPTIRPPGPVNRTLAWILSRLGNLLITPAYAPSSHEKVEAIQKRDSEIFWRDIENLGMALGMVPVFGDVIDIGMVFYYMVRGDYFNAFLSALAAIPLAGSGVYAFRMASKGAKGLDGVKWGVFETTLRANMKTRTGFGDTWVVNPFRGRKEINASIREIEEYIMKRLDPIFSDPEKVKAMAKNLKLTHPRGGRVKMSVDQMEDEIVGLAAKIAYDWKTGIMARLSVFIPMLFVICYGLAFLVDLISQGRPITKFLVFMSDEIGGVRGKSADMICDRMTGVANEIDPEERGTTLQEAKDKFKRGMEATTSKPGEENFYRLVEDNLEVAKEEAAEMDDATLIKDLFRMYNRDPDNFKWPGGVE